MCHARIHATEYEAAELNKLGGLLTAGVISVTEAADMLAKLRVAQQARALAARTEAA